MSEQATAVGAGPGRHSDRFDVVVVGARVAGAATALLLARSGHRVLLLDRARMPSDTVSTHAILRTGVLQLRRWGLLDRVVAAETPAVRDVTLGFGDERIPVRLATEHGVDALYAPRRHILDWLMIEAATDSGVEFRGSSRVTGLLRGRDRRVCGVVVGHGEEIDATVVIGADGTHSKIADLVGAPVQASHRATNAVHYGYFSGVEHQGFWFQFTPGVNAGLIQTNDDVTLAFVGRRREHLAAFRHDPEEDFFRWLRHAGADLARIVEAGTRVGGFRGTPGLAGYSRKPWGPGWALVGDAGYTKDPISAHGISDALRDAELCARAVDRSLRHGADEAAAMSEYWRVRDQLSSRIYREAAALAAYRWDAGEASARMRAISESVRDECSAIEALPPWAEATSAA